MSKPARRRFVLAASSMLAMPFAAHAQPTQKNYRIALILTTSPVSEMAGAEPRHPSIRAFLHRLRALGYAEGKNLTFERRSAEGRFERYPGIINDLIKRKTDVIVTVSDQMTQVAKKLTTTVPIVMMVYADPVESGLVSNLALPGGNITGVVFTPGPEIEGKRVELLKTALPKIKRTALLGMKRDWDDAFGKSVQSAARQMGVSLVHAEHTPTDYAAAFATITQEKPDALLVANTPPNFANRRLIQEFAAKQRLPAIYSRREPVEEGGLMSYGANVPDLFTRAATSVDKILKGARPGELPVEQPTKFEFVINLNTAKALGLNIAQSFLMRADELIR